MANESTSDETNPPDPCLFRSIAERNGTRNQGKTWRRTLRYTANSPYNHCYVRRPENVRDPFWCFWADGNPDVLSISHLYFADSEGRVYRLPYEMAPDQEWAEPKEMHYHFDSQF